MASVTSLDKDLRNMRLDKYTPQRATETLQWIESVLNERLSSPDLMEALKDGTVLCRLVNLVLGPNGVRFKKSAMPFVQMENISHFLRACQAPPLSLPPHDCFLTVDLYEQKDPAQVLQCLASFSRKAAALQPSKVSAGIGGVKASALSPQSSGAGGPASPNRTGGTPGSKQNLPASSPGTSTWSKRSDIGHEMPAWNIAQYGWTGGASQGNQGVAFGAPRQLVSQQPHVPSLAEKERRRRERAEEEERQQKLEQEEAEKRRLQRQEEEMAAQAEESRRWEEETKRKREQERQAAEAEKKRWEDEEKRWKEEEEQRLQEEKEAQARMEKERNSRPALQGQYLASQYQSGEGGRARSPARTAESERILELERQLEEARQREQQYQAERLKINAQKTGSSQTGAIASKAEEELPVSAPKTDAQPPVDDEWQSRDTERSFLRQQWKQNNNSETSVPASIPASTRPLPVPAVQPKPAAFSRPLPTPGEGAAATTSSRRPLPDPSAYAEPNSPQQKNRTDTFLSKYPAPEPTKPSSHIPTEAAFSSTAERDQEDARRVASQQKTRAGGWASKSLLEREMERERERQREWEEAQKETRDAVERGAVDPDAGVGPGQSWDVNTYGFTGGDNLNKGGAGVYSGRRQIIGGPRPMGGGGGGGSGR